MFVTEVARKERGEEGCKRANTYLLLCAYLFVCDESLRPCCLSVDDHSRVILQPIEDDPSSDYINANYIDVSGNASNATIGSQRNQRNQTPSLVCQASIPFLRLLVIHRTILRIQPPRQHVIPTVYVSFPIVLSLVSPCTCILSSS